MSKVPLYIQVADLRKKNLTPSEIKKRLLMDGHQFEYALRRARLNGLLPPARATAKPERSPGATPLYILIARLQNSTDKTPQEIMETLNITHAQYHSSAQRVRGLGIVKRRGWPALPVDAFQDSPRAARPMRRMTDSEAMAIAAAHDLIMPIQVREARGGR